MKFKTVFNLLYIGIFSLAINTVNAADIFTDSFETGDFSATNAQGFKWTTKIRTGIVNETHQTHNADGPVDLTKANATSHPGGDWTPHSGKYSMRFPYPKGEPWTEQRFDFGTPMKDVWIRFWLRVPINFAYGPTRSPNKLFSMWSDGYSGKGDGSTVWLGMLRIYGTTDSSFAHSYSDGGYKTSGGYKQEKVFATSKDRGRWMHLVLHFKTESSPGASDGIMQTFRRWQDETNYVKEQEQLNVPLRLPSDGKTNGFKAGYLIGWANAFYVEDTEWLMDDFVISDSSPMSKLTKLPNAPTDHVATGK